MGKKRVLIMNDLLRGGGVEKLMYDLVWAFHNKYDITILTDAEEKELFESLYPSDVKHIFRYIPKPKKDVKIAWQKYQCMNKLQFMKNAKLLTREHYDIAIAMKDGWQLWELAKLPIDTKYLWIHTDYNDYYYTDKIFESKDAELEAMKTCRRVVCVAESIKQSVIDVLGGDPGNLVVKFNPIHVDDILKKSKEPLVMENRHLSVGPRFVTVGRLNYQKGYTLLMEACHMLEKEKLDYELWVVGGEEPWGDEHERIKSAATRLGLKNVRFVGHQKNPYKYMKAADWFISSSLFEGYSMVSQEAALLDVPLILTDCSGVRDLIGDSEYGIVLQRSVLALYEGMKRVIDRPELQEYYKGKIKERKSIITYEERLREIERMLDEED